MAAEVRATGTPDTGLTINGVLRFRSGTPGRAVARSDVRYGEKAWVPWMVVWR